MAKRRQRDGSGAVELTVRQRTWLLTGCDWDFIDIHAGVHGLGGFPHHRAARVAWNSCRDELLKFWIENPKTWLGEPSFANPAPAGPGRRPFGFWQYDAKVPRVLIEELEPSKRSELQALGWFREKSWRGFFGRPAGDYAECETEGAYLLRHKLFIEGEEKALLQGPPGPTLVDDG